MTKYKFTPGIFPTVIFILLLPLFLVLGNWQIDRGEEKKRMREKYVSDLSEQPLVADETLLSSLKTDKDIIYKKIRLQAKLIGPVILLENRLYNGQSGYYVFAIAAVGKHHILANLGWVSGSADRTVYPDITLPKQSELTGVLKAPPYSGIKLSETPIENLADNVIRVQRIELERLGKELGIDLFPYIIRLEHKLAANLIIDWPELKFDSNKHYGYAFQWFAFAVILVFLYLWLNTHRLKDE